MTSNAIDSFLEDYQDLSDANIPVNQRNILCCCGGNCAHTQFNQNTLEDLESELRTAARLGKALLQRHETYVKDSEQEREAMMAHIKQLEEDKKVLERRNAMTVEDNRSLLDQLESLNNTVATSDQQVADLQSTLRTTQEELHRLSSLAARTEKLEQDIADFESDQAVWHSTLEEKEQTAKSALRRWHESQRALTLLQEEMERIDRDAKQERDRHTELLERMERRHAVERELNSAAGRLKGAAALKTSGTTSPNVVSHFVKDILQDNANLQMGIVELRDMLQNSNEEVDLLRKQLLNHGTPDATAVLDTAPAASHLKEEMRRATAQELHVHHHYHAPSATTPKNTTIRRPKKKRYGSLMAGHASGTSTPRSSVSYGASSAAMTILQQTAASLPEVLDGGHRWSLQTQRAGIATHASSGPSSPDSTIRTPSVFDRVFSDNGYDSSRPGTPETEDLGSPRFPAVHSKRPSNSSVGSYGFPSNHKSRHSLDSILDMSIENIRQIDQQNAASSAIIEEEEPDWNDDSLPALEEDSSSASPLPEPVQEYNPRPLRRAASHESLLSVSGMDIHTLRSRPSQLLTGQSGRSVTTSAVLTDMTALATRPTVITQSSATSRSILSGMASDQRHASAPKQGLSRKVSGWMFGRWGATPIPSSDAVGDVNEPGADGRANSSLPTKPLRVASATSSGDGRSVDDILVGTPQRRPKHRPPGINQMGPIPGFGPETKNLHPPILKSLDQEALRNLLGNAAET